MTTQYKIPNLDSPKYQKKLKRKRDGDTDGKDVSSTMLVPKAYLTLKTYDPESGAVLKFKTDRSQDVGRLVAGLARLGRHMAALPEKAEGKFDRVLVPTGTDSIEAPEVTMKDTADSKPDEGSSRAPTSNSSVPDSKPQQQPSAGGGGGKKKKKGKK